MLTRWLTRNLRWSNTRLRVGGGGTGVVDEVIGRSVKSMVRHVAAGAAGRLGVLAALERAARGSVTILCYHRVLPEDRRQAYHDPDLVVTPDIFRAHCRTLAARY